MTTPLPEARPRARGTDAALAAVALVTPLSLGFPWAVVPSHLGAALAGWPFFLRWLTKYPDLGPVNHEVLLGICCVVGAAVLPSALGGYRLGGGSSTAALTTLTALALVCFGPVLIRLDLDLYVIGAVGAPSLLGPERIAQPEALGGPLLRLAGLIACAGLTVRSRTVRTANTGKSS